MGSIAYSAVISVICALAHCHERALYFNATIYSYTFCCWPQGACVHQDGWHRGSVAPIPGVVEGGILHCKDFVKFFHPKYLAPFLPCEHFVKTFVKPCA